MEFTIIVTMLALAQYLFFVGRTGYIRTKLGLDAPACTGDYNFECMFRVQVNTLEQLVVFIPALWAFSYFVSPLWGPCLGLVYIVGRFVYAHAYLTNPIKRGPGMLMTFITNWILVIGSIIGAIISIIEK